MDWGLHCSKVYSKFRINMKYVIAILLLSNVIWSQNLEPHQWKDRVIVINAAENFRELADSQYELFKVEQQKLLDRKIVLYKCVANTCVFYNWKQKPKKFQIKNSIRDYSCVLIGLDGFQKYKSNKIENVSVFLDLIDTMPMRRQELENRRKKND